CMGIAIACVTVWICVPLWIKKTCIFAVMGVAGDGSTESSLARVIFFSVSKAATVGVWVRIVVGAPNRLTFTGTARLITTRSPMASSVRKFCVGTRLISSSGYTCTPAWAAIARGVVAALKVRSEEHTSELQSLRHLVCRLL